MKAPTYISVIAAGSMGLCLATQSCAAVAGTSLGLSIIKHILLGGISKGVSVLKDKDSFLGNALIDAAMPQQLKNINNSLQHLGMGSLVQKERNYIAQAAGYTAEIAQPVLINAVNNLSADDAVRIVQGGAGAATQLLRERTSAQLIAAFTPKVDQKLNEFGILHSLNSALSGSSMLGSLLGNSQNQSAVTGGISRLAAEQMVNGLFNIIQSHEQENRSQITNTVNSIK